MRRDPRVAVTVLDIADWYRAVTVLGRVVELRNDERLADIAYETRVRAILG